MLRSFRNDWPRMRATSKRRAKGSGSVPPWREPQLWVAALLVALGAAYSNHFDNSFHFDDLHTIVYNPAIIKLTNIPRFFFDARTFSQLPAAQTYRPLVTASLAIDYALSQGRGPFWFHVSTFVWFLLQL